MKIKAKDLQPVVKWSDYAKTPQQFLKMLDSKQIKIVVRHEQSND